MMDYQTYNKLRDKTRNYIYYIVIALISLVSVVFLPMVSSDLPGFDFPTTTAGWFAYVITRLGIAGVNVLFLILFMEQAKVNVSKDPKYIEANEILAKAQLKKEWVPRSPSKFQKSTYTKKGISLFFSSVLSVMSLADALLKFDIVAFLSYLVTIFFGVVFGFISMKKAEGYWTEEYWYYAKKIEKEIENGNHD